MKMILSFPVHYRSSLVFFVAAVIFSGAFACSSPPEADRPNVLLILADDMGFSDLGCYGSAIETPTLDELAAKGVRFSRFYNNARCCPSRAALLTGRYPHQVGLGGMTDMDVSIPEYQGYFQDSTLTIADYLKQKGYATYLSGKWHLGEEKGHWPLDHGFDHCFALINGAASYFDFLPYRNDQWPPGNELTLVEDNRVVDALETGFYATDLYTDRAMQMLEKKDTDQPFFLYLSYTAPHWPLHALPEDIARYEGHFDQGWDTVRNKRIARLVELGLLDSSTVPAAFSGDSSSWEDLTPSERDRETRLMEVYAAMIDRMDQNIGRLIDFLKARGEWDNTLLIFLSDNGAAKAGNLAGPGYKYAHPRLDENALPGTPTSFTGFGKRWAWVSNTPFRNYKASTYEGGTATPFIVHYPPMDKGGTIDTTAAHIVDVLPTILGLSNIAEDQASVHLSTNTLSGVDLSPVIRGTGAVEDRPLYFEHLGYRGLIQKEWKAVQHKENSWELYHLGRDRGETNDLADTEPERLYRMTELYRKWANQNNILPPEAVMAASPHRF